MYISPSILDQTFQTPRLFNSTNQLIKRRYTVTGNKLNCFISASGMLAIVWYCVLLFFCVCFFVDFLHVNKSSSQKKDDNLVVKQKLKFQRKASIIGMSLFRDTLAL